MYLLKKITRISLLGLYAAVVLLACSGAGAQQPQLFHLKAPFGQYAVGLKVVHQYDYSRAFYTSIDQSGKPYAGERARPLQTLIWYPAKKSDRPMMRVADYVALLSTETNFSGDTTASVRGKRLLDDMGASRDASLHAALDADVLSGRFPLVIYAPGLNGVSWENADLCEYLASHGFVVIASPSMGPHTWSDIGVVGLETQAQDISFLVGYARTLPDTDMTSIAVGGYSWGGLSNLIAAARDSRIRALFCLDGSLRYYPSFLPADVHPEQMTIPLLEFTQGELSIESLIADGSAKIFQSPSILNEMTHGDLTIIDMFGMTHSEFSAMTQRNEYSWQTAFPTQEKGDYDRQDGAVSYSWIAQYTLRFLNGYLKHDAGAVEFLKRTPAENGVPPHLMSVKYRAAAGLPPSLETFKAELGRQGFDHAGDVYTAMQKEDPKFAISEESLAAWTFELVSAGHPDEAIRLLQWNAATNSKSPEAYTHLGDTYHLMGKNKEALEAYQHALALTQDDRSAQRDSMQRKIRWLEEQDRQGFGEQ